MSGSTLTKQTNVRRPKQPNLPCFLNAPSSPEGAFLFGEEKRSGNEKEEHHGDDAIQGKERSIEATQVSRGDDEMLIKQQQCHCCYASPGDGMKRKQF